MMLKTIVVLLTAALMAGLAHGGPISTCALQKDCISWMIEKYDDGCGDTCAWKVCLTIDLSSSETCIKNDCLSHSCVKPDGVCDPLPGTFVGAFENNATVCDTFPQCQIGTGSGEVSFLLKDGNNGDGCGIETDVSTPVGSPAGASISCGGLDGVDSCTGNPINMECVWKVKLPDCPVTTTPPPTTTTPPPATGSCPTAQGQCDWDTTECVWKVKQSTCPAGDTTTPPPTTTTPPPTTSSDIDTTGSCPPGPGICYSKGSAGCCNMGHCTPQNGTDLAEVLVGYTGAAGSYQVEGACPGGKGLSNSIKIIDADSKACTKEEPNGSRTEFTIAVDGDGNVLTAFSMKCGTQCYIYGDFPIACNNEKQKNNNNNNKNGRMFH